MSGKASIVDSGGIERAVVKATITVDGTERKVAKIMQTVDGKWQNVFSSGVVLKYTGKTDLGENQSYEFDEGMIDLKFLSSGTLTVVDGEGQIEAFLQGGGFSGSNGSSRDQNIGPEGYKHQREGGKGGNGGKHISTSAISFKPGDSFDIVIGTTGKATTAFDLSSSSGKTAAVGGRGASEGQGAYEGGDGEFAFGDSTYDGIKYGAAGGGGSHWASINNGRFGKQSDGKDGGISGGGAGAKVIGDGTGGTANQGAGGGGGTGGNGSGGKGSDGICIIRSVKEAAK